MPHPATKADVVGVILETSFDDRIGCDVGRPRIFTSLVDDGYAVHFDNDDAEEYARLAALFEGLDWLRNRILAGTPTTEAAEASS